MNQRPKLSSYRDLEVWWKSKELVVDLYRVTEKFPKREWKITEVQRMLRGLERSLREAAYVSAKRAQDLGSKL